MSPARLSLLGLLCLAAPLAAQSREAYQGGRRPALPRAWEIALARSAAPSEITAQATVLVLTDTGYAVAERGSNGVTCYVGRGWPESIEPHCFDEEGTATILPMALRRAAMRQQGKTHEEIEADIAEGLASGRFRLPRRPAMSYMMSGAQVLYNDEGKRVGAWRPHLMIYYPWISGSDMGIPKPDLRTAVIVDEGTPVANIMIVVRDFIQPDSSAMPR